MREADPWQIHGRSKADPWQIHGDKQGGGQRRVRKAGPYLDCVLGHGPVLEHLDAQQQLCDHAVEVVRDELLAQAVHRCLHADEGGHDPGAGARREVQLPGSGLNAGGGNPDGREGGGENGEVVR